MYWYQTHMEQLQKLSIYYTKKAGINKFQNTEIKQISLMLVDLSQKLIIEREQKTYNVWKLYYIQNNLWVRDETEMKLEMFELKNNQYTTSLNVWNAAKVIFREKFIVLNKKN